MGLWKHCKSRWIFFCESPVIVTVFAPSASTSTALAQPTSAPHYVCHVRPSDRTHLMCSCCSQRMPDRSRDRAAGIAVSSQKCGYIVNIACAIYTQAAFWLYYVLPSRRQYLNHDFAPIFWYHILRLLRTMFYGCTRYPVWWAGYLAFFIIQFWFEPKCWMETGYCNRIFYSTDIDVRKFTYLLATKPCYLLQSATKEHKSNYWNLLVNYSWISKFIVHNVYSKTCIPHRQIAVKWGNHHTICFRFRPVGKSAVWFWPDCKIYYPVHPYSVLFKARMLH